MSEPNTYNNLKTAQPNHVPRNEEQIKERLAKIEDALLKTDSLEKIWELKAEHRRLTRELKRAIRARVR